MIEARGLAKSYGSVPALAGLDLSIPAGTTTCLIGPNGAGKTTAVRILTTLLRPDGGWAKVAGHDVVSDGSSVRCLIGLSGQYASLDECLTGRANLVMVGELGRLSRREAKQRAGDMLALFGLEKAAGRPVRTYSGGMRRRLDLAASLLRKPTVLFLDEPTSGLDPPSRRALWGIVSSRVETGTTVLLTTQNLEEADRLADRICVLDGGRVVAEGTPAQLKENIGTAHLLVTLQAASPVDAAAAVLAAHAAGPVRCPDGQDLLEVPVLPRAGLVTEIVKALDAAGIGVNDISVRRPSLEEIYHALASERAA